MECLKIITIDSWERYESEIMALETQAFSAAQCHSPAFYLRILNDVRSLCYIALIDKSVVGFLFSGPLELFDDYAGVKSDPYFNAGVVLYSADMVVAPEYRQQGIGKAFKQQQLLDAKQQGFRVVAGRNRLQYAHAMWCVNQALGAKEVQRLTGIYKDGREPNACIYYHIAL